MIEAMVFWIMIQTNEFYRLREVVGEKRAPVQERERVQRQREKIYN